MFWIFTVAWFIKVIAICQIYHLCPSCIHVSYSTIHKSYTVELTWVSNKRIRWRNFTYIYIYTLDVGILFCFVLVGHLVRVLLGWLAWSLLYRSGWLWTQNLPPASASQLLGLKMCNTTPMQQIHNGVGFRHEEWNYLLSAGKEMQLEIIILNESSQCHKDKYHAIFLFLVSKFYTES